MQQEIPPVTLTKTINAMNRLQILNEWNPQRECDKSMGKKVNNDQEC